MSRIGTIDRKTAETQIQLTLNLDGTGTGTIATGVAVMGLVWFAQRVL